MFLHISSVRAGREVTFLARELVPGDIIVLNMGDRVPADVRLYEVSQIEYYIYKASFCFANVDYIKLRNCNMLYVTCN